MTSKKRYPDFLGIGATRAGTSWLHYVLATHPDIWVSPVKELHYYDRPMNGQRTVLKNPLRFKWRVGSYLKGGYDVNNDGFLRCMNWDLNFFLKRRSENWYKSLFTNAGSRLAGEVTPAYAILDKATVARIAANNSELRSIYFLRHPIARGWSDIVNSLAKKRRVSINNVSEQDMLSRIEEPDFLARTNYADNIRRWRSVFGENKLFIGFFEDIQKQPDVLINRLCEFLGVRGSGVIDNQRLRSPQNASTPFSAPIPPNVEFNLAKKLYPMIREIQELLGGYADQWLEDAEKILRRSA